MQNTQENTYTSIPSKEVIDRTMDALKENNFKPEFVSTKEEALKRIQEIIPEGVSLMNGSSTTLQEIGFVDLLKSKEHKWENLHDTILEETDPEKQAELRRKSAVSDYYIGSVHAVSETGELVIASNSGSQLAHIVYTSPNLVFVVGAQKIMPTLSESIKRLENHVIDLEDKRMQKEYGMGTKMCIRDRYKWSGCSSI